MKYVRILICLVFSLLAVVPMQGRRLNDKVQNRPYADLKRWHLGFSVGMYASDLLFTHNGLVTDDGKQWRMDQPDYQPGFCVNGLIGLRLNKHFELRFNPGMYFGSRDIHSRDINSEATERQNIKSTFIVLPVDIKFAALRYRNARPYAMAGVMPTFDVGKKSNDLLKLSASDIYLSLGFGCDFYLPYFKLVPELKFCFGLRDLLVHDRPDLVEEPGKYQFTKSLSKATSKMVVLTFYFE